MVSGRDERGGQSAMETIQAHKRTHEVISADEYVRRREKDPRRVTGAEIVPPTLGTGGFGGFRVQLDRPVYESDLDAC